MPLSPHRPCRLALTPVGWYLTFPGDPAAGLLLTEPEEKAQFARDCGIDLHPCEYTATWFFEEIDRCPPYWYAQARTFKSPTFA